MRNPLISVIIPTYNRPGFLMEAVASVQNQTVRNLEIIVINDCGKSVRKQIEYLRDKRIIYVEHESNKGLSAARNTGLSLATGKYVAYLDDDDVYYKQHLATLLTAINTYPEKLVYTDSIKAIQHQANKKYITSYKILEYSSKYNPESLLINNYIPVLCILHDRSCLKNVGFFDETLNTHEDWDFWIRFSEIYPFRHVQSITSEYRVRDDATNMTTTLCHKYIKDFTKIYGKTKYSRYYNEQIGLAQQRILSNMRIQLFSSIQKVILQASNKTKGSCLAESPLKGYEASYDNEKQVCYSFKNFGGQNPANDEAVCGGFKRLADSRDSKDKPQHCKSLSGRFQGTDCPFL